MRLKSNGIGMAYEFSGPEDAPCLILHHSLCTNRHMWDTAARVLDEEFRVLRFDARGHGQTDATEAPYDFDILCKDVLGAMDALEIDKAHYLGLSMGGVCGQHLALRAPERLESLILVSTTSQVPAAGKKAWDERIEAVRARGMESQVQPTLQRWFTEPFRETDDPILADIAHMIRKTPVKGFIGWGLAIRDTNISDEIKAIKLPTLVIVGDQDQGTPVEGARLIHQQIEGSELKIMDEASHQLPLERPQEFVNMVTSFLATV